MVAFYDLDDLLRKLNIAYSAVGANVSIYNRFAKIAPKERGREDDLIFINVPDDNTIKILTETKASCILLEAIWGQQHLTDIEKLGKRIYLVAHPRLVIAKLMKHIYKRIEAKPSGIHPTAIIDRKANIHKSVFIGPYCIIGNCSIGEGSQIHSHAIINDHVRIGKNVTIREHCLIGSDGFAFPRDDKGTLLRLTHIGGVIIEDNVEIFPFSNVDRGTFGDTVIESGTKIDHYVHVGHNSRIERDCFIAAGVVFCGSSTIGAKSWAGVGSIIKQSTKVGRCVTLGLGAVVIKDVDDGDTVAGVPAKSLQKKKRRKV